MKRTAAGCKTKDRKGQKKKKDRATWKEGETVMRNKVSFMEQGISHARNV